MQKVICTGSVIGRVQIGSVRFSKFAANVEFYVWVNIRVEICGNQKFQIALLCRSDGFVDHDVRRLDSLRYRLASENVKFAADKL
jgi:hypothetical protein